MCGGGNPDELGVEFRFCKMKRMLEVKMVTFMLYIWYLDPQAGYRDGIHQKQEGK